MCLTSYLLFRYLHPNVLLGLDGERWANPIVTIRYQVHKEVCFSFLHWLRSSATSTSDAEEFLLSARNSVIASATFTTSLVKRSHKCSFNNRKRNSTFTIYDSLVKRSPDSYHYVFGVVWSEYVKIKTSSYIKGQWYFLLYV